MVEKSTDQYEFLATTGDRRTNNTFTVRVSKGTGRLSFWLGGWVKKNILEADLYAVINIIRGRREEMAEKRRKKEEIR